VDRRRTLSPYGTTEGAPRGARGARGGLVAAAAALLIMCLAAPGCASSPEEAPPADAASLVRPEERGALARGEGSQAHVWFAARASPCERVVDALAVFAAQPGVVAPEAVRVSEQGPWCAVRGEGRRRTRAESWAQSVSAILETPAIAYYVTGAAWSFAVFDRGVPVSAMEAHYGAPSLVGELARAADALGVPQAALEQALAEARRPEAHAELAARIGFAAPRADAPRLTLADRRPPPPEPEPAEPARPAFEAGEWVAMPPMGVALVTAVEEQELAGGGRGLVYLLAAGRSRFPVPVAQAERLRVRRVVSAERAEELLAELRRSAPVVDGRQYVEPRTRGWLDGLKRGDIEAIARAFRQLCTIRGMRTLYAIEEGLLGSAREWLIAELSVARGESAEATEARLPRACRGP